LVLAQLKRYLAGEDMQVKPISFPIIDRERNEYRRRGEYG